MVQKQFITNITKNRLFTNTDKLLVAVSGGLDSMVLCDLLLQNKFTFSVAHCNFQLRGAEADAEEKFVEEFCKKNNIPFFVQRFDTMDFAENNNRSIQMAARELRYTWFSELLQKHNFTFLLTAHHLSDNVETFFINLIRGAGINGLKGMEMKKETLVRPLLEFTREQIEAYAVQHAIAHKTDSSNADDKYLRNDLRLNIIPEFKKINPAFEQTMKAELKYLSESNDIVKNYVRACKAILSSEAEGVLKIDIEKLKQQQSYALVLFEILRDYSFNSTTVNDIEENLDAESGKIFFSETHECLKDRSSLLIRAKQKNKLSELFFIQKTTTHISQPLDLTLSSSHLLTFSPSSTKIILDSDKLSFPLTIEKWKQGDKFKPLGMSGFKKLSDFFTDEKMSLFDKENQWLLKSGDDIVWVIGKRIDDRFKITSSTKNTLIIELN